MNKVSGLKQFESVAVFLIFELLALTTFGLGAINVVFHIAGFLVAVFSFVCASGNFKKKELLGLLPLIIPLVIFACLVSFGTADYYRETSANNIFTFLGIISFFIMGLAARRSESFNIKTALICIGGGLALLTIINTIATWFDYGPFYPLIYANTPDGYYRGQIIDLTSEMNILYGFKFFESRIVFGQQFPVLLSASIPALFFVDRKKNFKEFVIIACFAVISLISVITITSLKSIIFVVIVTVIGVLYRFFSDNVLFKKLIKWTLLIVGILALVIFVFVCINAAGNNGLSNFIANNSFLNRVFNTNGFMKDINDVLKAAFKPFNLLGFNRTNLSDKDFITNAAWDTNTKHFELEIIKEGGIFSFVALLVFAVFAYFSVSRYLAKSNDSKQTKSIILSFVVVFVLYMSFCYDAFPLIHNERWYNSFTRGFLFLVILFLLGYMASSKNVDPITFERKQNTKNVEFGKTVVEDYDFSDSDEEVKHE